MNSLDTQFFEQYKKLDNMLSDMLTCENGVTEYINEMDSTPDGPRWIENWNYFHKKLKRLRWVRNKIAHESENSYSTEKDYADLMEVYDSFLSETDPLTLLENVSGKAPQKIPDNVIVNDIIVKKEKPSAPKKAVKSAPKPSPAKVVSKPSAAKSVSKPKNAKKVSVSKARSRNKSNKVALFTFILITLAILIMYLVTK